MMHSSILSIPAGQDANRAAIFQTRAISDLKLHADSHLSRAITLQTIPVKYAQ